MSPFEARANTFLRHLSAELGARHPLFHEAAHLLTLAYAEMDKT